MKAIPHTQPARWPAKIPPGRWAATVRRDSPAGCAVALLGLPDDTGVKLNHGRPGAAGGPTAFRTALASFGAADSAAGKLPRVFDAGDIRRGRSLEETHARVTAAATALLERGLFPIAVGGGHDLTFPFVRAITARWPRPAGLYFDAHLDVRPTRGSGMPFRKLVEECGVSALHLHGFRPLVNSREHLAWFTGHGGRLYPDDGPVRLPVGASSLATAGPRVASKVAPTSKAGARNVVRRVKDLFVSFDLDVLDAAHAPGVSALNPDGWSVQRAAAWVRACGADRRVRCFDLMELNPVHDLDQRTARVAAHLFLTFLAGFAQR